MNEEISIIPSGYISFIGLSTQPVPPIRTIGNYRYRQNQQLGYPYHEFTDVNNENIPEEQRNFIRNEFIKSLYNDAEHKTTRTLTIDRAILDDEELLNAIRNHIESYKNKYSEQETYDPTIVIRIADEGYTLTREDYEKLSFIERIAVDNCEEELRNNNKIIIQNGVFKYDEQHHQPVIERRQDFNDMINRTSFHITHELTTEEFEYLANAINNCSSPAIELDYFNPEYYEEFLRNLQRHNVRNNISIQLIGYLLEDRIEQYRNLQNYPYEIDIVYSTCRDMINNYQDEPYSENRLYYSEIEGGGKTSLANYLNVIRFFEEFEQQVQENRFSPLETAVFAKMKLDSTYIYDPNYRDENTDDWNNTNLSQMLNQEDNGRRRAICLGFSTLYSAMLRRNKIPMFRYGTREHERNIGRINDPKYDVDTICTCDNTWDLQSSNANLATYTHFLLSPREYLYSQNDNNYHEPMTIAHTLALPFNDYYNNFINTTQAYDLFYNPLGIDYNGYTARMLELMGVVPESEDRYFNSNDLYNNIYNLCANGHLESVPSNKIVLAMTNVLQKASNQIGVDDVDNYIRSASESFNYRQDEFNSPPALAEDINGEIAYAVTPITQENVRRYQETLENDINEFESQLMQQQTPEPVQEPTPEPVQEPTPGPVQEPTPGPVQEPTPEPVQEPTPEPVQEPTPEPVQEPTPEPVQEPTPEPVQEPTPEPVQRPVPVLNPNLQPNEETVVRTTPWKWVKDHKKQILIVLGLAAMAVSLYMIVTSVMPALIAANNAQLLSNSLAVMSKNAAQWHTAAPAMKAALHASSEAIAGNISSLTGLQTIYTGSTGVWTIGGQTLSAATTAAAKVAADAAATVKGLQAASLVTGIGGLGLLGGGILSKEKSAEYNNIIARLSNLRQNIDRLSVDDFNNECRQILSAIDESNLSNSHKNELQRKLNRIVIKRRKRISKNHNLSRQEMQRESMFVPEPEELDDTHINEENLTSSNRR